MLVKFINENNTESKTLPVSSTFDSTKTQILKNINGSLTWVDE